MSAAVRFKRNRIIRLRRGQSIALVCGKAVVTRRITLSHGQFVVATCDAIPRVIVVGCRSFIVPIFVFLKRGERLVVTCR